MNTPAPTTLAPSDPAAVLQLQSVSFAYSDTREVLQ